MNTLLVRGESALCLAAALLLFVACAGPRDDGPGSSVRDSSGIRIVENRTAAGGRELDTWAVEETPVLDVGGNPSEGSELYQVTAAARMRDGLIVVASAGSQQIRLYDPRGRLLRSIGRAGDGPGEFRFPSWVGTTGGDSIAVWDQLLGRLSVFTPTGELGRVVTPSHQLGTSIRAFGMLADGKLVAAVGSFREAPPQGRAYRDSIDVVILGPDGQVTDTIGRFPGAEMVALGTPATGLLMRTLPFGRQTLAAVHGRLVYVATGDTYDVAVYEPGRGLRARIRAHREPMRVTPDDIRDYQKSVVTLGGEGDAELQTKQNELLKEAPYPETMPALTGLQVDSEGNVWVEEPRRPGEDRGALWTVFTADGRARASLRLPAGLAVHQVGSDWLVGVALDSDDVEHVQVFRVNRQ